jgi:hypothetical protein
MSRTLNAKVARRLAVLAEDDPRPLVGLLVSQKLTYEQIIAVVGRPLEPSS